MLRFALCLVISLGACTPAQAPKARKAGEAMAIGGVVGLIATSAVARYTSGSTREILIGFSVLSAAGIVTFAAGDLSTPASRHETLPERHHRWAKILTERASGAARDGRCPRVRRLEVRVRTYDPEIHDFVFMRDPEILKCMAQPDVSVPPDDSALPGP